MDITARNKDFIRQGLSLVFSRVLNNTMDTRKSVTVTTEDKPSLVIIRTGDKPTNSYISVDFK